MKPSCAIDESVFIVRYMVFSTLVSDGGSVVPQNLITKHFSVPSRRTEPTRNEITGKDGRKEHNSEENRQWKKHDYERTEFNGRFGGIEWKFFGRKSSFSKIFLPI